jgi:hypothetical protein
MVILTYPSGSVGSHLGTGTNLLPYKYKGVRPIDNPRTHSNQTNLLYLPLFIIHVLGVDVVYP